MFYSDRNHRDLLELQRVTGDFLAQLRAMFTFEEAALLVRAMAESLNAGVANTSMAEDANRH